MLRVKNAQRSSNYSINILVANRKNNTTCLLDYMSRKSLMTTWSHEAESNLQENANGQKRRFGMGMKAQVGRSCSKKGKVPWRYLKSRDPKSSWKS